METESGQVPATKRGCKLSNEKKPGCLGYIRDYPTQLCGDSSKPSVRIRIKQPVQSIRIPISIKEPMTGTLHGITDAAAAAA